MVSWNLTSNDTTQSNSEMNDTVLHKVDAGDRKALGITLSTPILMMTTGILGNLLALLILFTAHKQVRHTAFFPLLMAMACSDLLGQVCTGAIAVIVYANNLRWVGGRPVCLYHGFAMVFFAVITPLLVCSMAVERMLALRFSYFHQRCFTSNMAKSLVWGSVIFTLFFCSWPLLGFGSFEQQYPGSWCFLNYHRESLKDTIYALVFSVLNIFIIVVIVVCNVTVVWTLLKMRRLRRHMRTKPSVASEQAVDGRPRCGLHMEMETQMVWFLLAVTVVFSCLWIPINVHILINQITGVTDIRQDLITVRLASINQIVDPWMYVIFRKSTFLKCLRRLRRFVVKDNKDRAVCASHKIPKPSFSPTSQLLITTPATQNRQPAAGNFLNKSATGQLLPGSHVTGPLSASATDNVEISTDQNHN